jgi:very-short-patch-repair endonuclease
METPKYKRNCPKCGVEVTYTKKYGLDRAIKENRFCRMCSSNDPGLKKYLSKINTGITHPQYGTHQSSKRKMLFSLSVSGNKHWTSKLGNKSHPCRGKKISEETRIKFKIASKKKWENPIIRKKYYDALTKTKYLKVRTDIGQLEYINNLNRQGFNFEPNYQLQTIDHLYYVDGYDKNKHVVLEYDNKYHITSRQKEKDFVRQQNIIKHFEKVGHPLNSFLRVLAYNNNNKIVDILKMSSTPIISTSEEQGKN